jgi:hypothetical protein
MLNLSILIKPCSSALGQPLQMAAHVSKQGDPSNLLHRRGKWLHHGGDVCGIVVLGLTVNSVLFLP